MKKSEFELIGRIRKMFPSKPGITGIGDDAAVIEDGFLVTTDALCDGTHFLSDRVHFRDLGYKSLAVNVSDIAAMGGRPLHALLTVGLTKKTSDKQIEELLAGIKKCSKEFDIDLIGGDTVRSENLFISVTLFGKPVKKPVLRSGAKKDDFIYVSGKLGDSAIGLELLQKKNQFPVKEPAYFIKRHDIPQPRVRLMETLVKNYNIRSCIDCSDGFLADLGHICEMSGSGYLVDAGNLPVSAEKIGKSYRDGRRYFLGLAAGGGEDYELIFTSPDRIDGADIRKKTGIQVTCVGLITGNRGRFETVLDGKPLKPGEMKSGFSHF
jgi:thiamine-monophosphate kinase